MVIEYLALARTKHARFKIGLCENDTKPLLRAAGNEAVREITRVWFNLPAARGR